MTSPDYSRLASQYDGRYRVNALPGVGAVLLDLVRVLPCPRVLEVGCGTGHWLDHLRRGMELVVGLDLSADMLREARGKGLPALVRASAERLPVRSDCFDVVFCVNALHHFPDPRRFVAEAARVLAPGGTLAIVGMDPRAEVEMWVYEYFEGTREADLRRFPAWATVREWMEAEGLLGVECRPVERIVDPQQGRALLASPFLAKGSSSQLALLTEEAYAAGVQRIEEAIRVAEARGETARFVFDVRLSLIRGQLPK
jgi:ubiquinone/menaquinone biosynthesis C-methylase UbiE